MYKAIEDFIDLQDNNFRYHAGDTFPRAGKEVSTARLMELMGAANRRGRPVIAAEPVEAEPVEKKPVEPVEEEKPKKRKATTRKRTKKDAD